MKIKDELLSAAKDASVAGNTALEHELYERANRLHANTGEALTAAHAILADSTKPYAFHYHDLPSRRINLTVLAASYVESAEAIESAVSHLRRIALNHAEPARSGVVAALNVLSGVSR